MDSFRQALRQPDEVHELMTSFEVAALLRISVQHLRKLAKAGLVPRPKKVGHRLRWWRSEILEYLNRK
jgi:predicted DNA-binding transcriptional regulator AlpA